jgi:hypothetical protein
VYGNQILNANKLAFSNGYSIDNNMLSIMNNRWRTIDNNGNVVEQVVTIGGVQQVKGASPDVLGALNQNATIWQPAKGISSYLLNSWAIENGSFLRVNNITFGYTLQKSLVTKLSIRSLRVYATVNNAALITNYTGYDPEVNTRRATPVTPGVDYSAYPRARTFILGVNVGF